MARTRSNKTTTTAATAAAAAAAPPERQTASTSPSARYTLSTSSDGAPKLFVLPKSAGPDACVVTLPNPRYSKPTRYLACPETGIYEFAKITAAAGPGTTTTDPPRSWLVAEAAGAGVVGSSSRSGSRTRTVQLVEVADLYVATPLDPLFLLLPALVPSASAKTSAATGKPLFLTSQDHFDTLPTLASHLAQILRWRGGGLRSVLEGRMRAVCDTVDAGDETMYRLNEQKLLGVLVAKARAMSEPSLPASLEDKFVKKALEAPLVRRKQVVSAAAAAVTLADKEEEASLTVSSVSVVETVMDDAVAASMTASADVVRLQRLRTAFDFISSAYLPPALGERLRGAFNDPGQSSIDFSSLDDYLGLVSKARADAVALRSMGDYSQKHCRDEVDDARLEKKRKVDEEKKRKATVSHGVKQLAKVDTSGMKKLSHFFKKK